MKPFRTALLGIFSCVGVIAAATYMSCTPRDTCSLVCLNGGVCNNKVCICPTIYTGTNCEVSAYVGTWGGTESVNLPTSSYPQTLTIVASSRDVTEMRLYLSAGHASGDTLDGYIESTGRLVYYKQIIHTATTPDTATGYIMFSNTNSLTNIYTVTHSHDSITYQIEGVYTRQ